MLGRTRPTFNLGVISSSFISPSVSCITVFQFWVTGTWTIPGLGWAVGIMSPAHSRCFFPWPCVVYCYAYPDKYSLEDCYAICLVSFCTSLSSPCTLQYFVLKILVFLRSSYFDLPEVLSLASHLRETSGLCFGSISFLCILSVF